jgi:hypothetical protein
MKYPLEKLPFLSDRKGRRGRRNMTQSYIFQTLRPLRKTLRPLCFIFPLISLLSNRFIVLLGLQFCKKSAQFVMSREILY